MGNGQSDLEKLQQRHEEEEEERERQRQNEWKKWLEKEKREKRLHDAAMQKEKEDRARELRRVEEKQKRELKEIQESLRREQLQKEEALKKALEEEKLKAELKRIELQRIEEERLKEKRIEENKRASEEMKKKKINELRDELENLKPGDSVEFPDGKTKFPEMLNVGLFGTTGIGKSSLLNSLKFAFKGELTELTREQTSTDNFQGGNTVRRLGVQITKHLKFIDNRGVGAEDLENIDAGNEIICQLEGRSSFAEKVDWRNSSRSRMTPVNKDKRIYCTVLVFNAQNPQSVFTVLKKLVEQIFEWQGRYPIGVITHVDEAAPEQLEDMYVVLNAAGLADTYEVANITNRRQELHLDHQLNLLKLMVRCIKEGDRIFSLREDIERLEVQQAIDREREVEEAKLEQARIERKKEEERKAKEAEEARIAKEKERELQEKIDEGVKLKLQEEAERERRAKEARQNKIFYFLALLILLYIIIYYDFIALL